MGALPRNNTGIFKSPRIRPYGRYHRSRFTNILQTWRVHHREPRRRAHAVGPRARDAAPRRRVPLDPVLRVGVRREVRALGDARVPAAARGLRGGAEFGRGGQQQERVLDVPHLARGAECALRVGGGVRDAAYTEHAELGYYRCVDSVYVHARIFQADMMMTRSLAP